MRTLDFLANANAASTENAAVVIGHEATMRGVNLELGMEIRNGDVRESDLFRERLQFTVTIRYAYRTDVIALREEQFEEEKFTDVLAN